MTLTLVPHAAEKNRVRIWAAVAGAAQRPGDLQLTAGQRTPVIGAAAAWQVIDVGGDLPPEYRTTWTQMVDVVDLPADSGIRFAVWSTAPRHSAAPERCRMRCLASPIRRTPSCSPRASRRSGTRSARPDRMLPPSRRVPASPEVSVRRSGLYRQPLVRDPAPHAVGSRPAVPRQVPDDLDPERGSLRALAAARRGQHVLPRRRSRVLEQPSELGPAGRLPLARSAKGLARGGGGALPELPGRARSRREEGADVQHRPPRGLHRRHAVRPTGG